MYCTNLLIVLGPCSAVKIDSEVCLLLHFTNFLMKIGWLSHSVQAMLTLNSIYRQWIDMSVQSCFDSSKSISC